MIIPSIDLMAGRAVQLRRGRELVLEGGDPFERLEEFSVAGEVAVVDLDAALGNGSNTDIVREMVRHAPCRVGGGIRDLDTAFGWLDAGAARVVIGTAASVDFCSRLPRDRVVAAVDAEEGTVVVEGWRTTTSYQVIDRIKELAPAVGGLLLTQVEHEGGMSGFSMALVEQAVEAAGAARVTAAGGIATVDDIASLDRLGVDAQVGMALYSGRLTLGPAVAAPLTKGVDDRLWPTVVCDESGATLGLVWSTRESLEAAVSQRRGIYWSRSRNTLWTKGATSGATQQLLRVDLDCDRDALRFTVRQHGDGFCHTGERACWPSRFTLASLGRVIAARRNEMSDGPARQSSTQADTSDSEKGRSESFRDVSGTARLLSDPTLMKAKLLEEAAELSEACHTGERACWPSRFTLASLGRVIAARRNEMSDGPARQSSTQADTSDSEKGRSESFRDVSGTARLLSDPTLMKAKLLEEAAELSEASDRASATHEAADLIYFALVAGARHGVTLEDIQDELGRRNRRIRRRPMVAKPEGGEG